MLGTVGFAVYVVVYLVVFAMSIVYLRGKGYSKKMFVNEAIENIFFCALWPAAAILALVIGAIYLVNRVLRLLLGLAYKQT